LNEEINAPEIRLIGAEGEQLGVVSSRQANYLAEEAGLDLVEIAPQAAPPVCRIMDYGKFKYQEAKKAHEAKQKQKQVQVKEIKLRPGTDENDYQIKLRNMIRFLEEEDKVKVTLRFRGREMAHQEFGMRQLERVKVDLEPYGLVEQMPRMEGRQMIMIIAPVKKKPGDKAEKPAKPGKTEQSVEKSEKQAANKDKAVA
jgi:translation initiation factor IF-3